MIDISGPLRKFWHPLALTSELKPGQSLKRRFSGHPLLIWKDVQGRVHACDDCCAHRRAPLDVIDFYKNTIACSYHGWEYDGDGRVNFVPSDVEGVALPRCSVPIHHVMDRHGFVWLLPDGEATDAEATALLDDMLCLGAYSNWVTQQIQKEFVTTDQLLIENFLDPTHTTVVHGKLIRDCKHREDHDVTVSSHEFGVRADYSPRQERVGLGARLLYGKTMLVHHVDEFLLPNLVRVSYEINGQACFLAVIACVSLEAAGGGKSLALVQLRHRFGKLSSLLRPAIALIAELVLRQDQKITGRQFANHTAFPAALEHLTSADAVLRTVFDLRRRMLSDSGQARLVKRTIRIRF